MRFNSAAWTFCAQNVERSLTGTALIPLYFLIAGLKGLLASLSCRMSTAFVAYHMASGQGLVCLHGMPWLTWAICSLLMDLTAPPSLR